MRPAWTYIEEYKGCTCSSEANRKRDLLGYCKFHGSQRRHVHKVPANEAAKKLLKRVFGD